MPIAAFGQDDEVVAESFGAGDEMVGEFGQEDEIVSTPGAFVGAVNALRRGIIGAQAVAPTIATAAIGDTRPTLGQERLAFERAMLDPGYQPALMSAGEDTEALARAESLFGPRRRLGEITAQQNAIRDVWAGVTSEFQRERQAVPQSKAQKEMAAAKTTGDKWKVFRTYPGQTISSIMLESLPPAIAGGLIGTAVGGPGAGTAVGAGLASASQEFSGEFLNEASRAGFDPTDENKLSAFLDSPAYAPAVSRAMTRAGIVGGMDAATAGVAGRFIEPALKEGLKRVIAASGKEIALQAGGGAGGELAAQLATSRPVEPLDWFDIAMEGIAEIATGPTEAFGNIRETIGTRQGQPAVPATQEAQLVRERFPEFQEQPPAVEPAAPAPPAPEAQRPQTATLDLGEGFRAEIDPQTATINYFDKSGSRVGWLRTVDLPGGEIGVENHHLTETARERGFGQRAIERLSELTGRTIVSDQYPSADARNMWDRLGAKREKVQIGEEEQSRYIYRPKQSAPPSEPEIVGMGGAIPAEFVPSGGTATSIKNAVVERERAARGLPSAIQPAKRSFGEVWDLAMATVDADPGVQEALISELKKKPRSLTDLEDALLLHRQIDLQNDYGKLTRELAQAFSDAEQFPSRLADVESLKLRVQDASNKLLELYEINKSSGTETGRGLNARKMMANEDFTLAQMEVQRRVDKDGAPLTDADRAEITAVHDKLQRLQAEFDALTQRVEAAQQRQRADQTMTDLQAEAAKDPEYSPQVLKLADRIVSTLNTRADAARVRLREKLARTSAGVDPTILADVVEIMAAHLAEKTVDFARASARLIEDFGEKVRPYIQPAWDAAQKNFERTVRNVAGGSTDAVVRQIRSEDPTQQRTSLINSIAEAAREERPLDEIGAYIRNLALRLVKDGVTNRDALIDTIHNILKNSFDPEITRRETMDAISGYGDWKPLDKDAAKTTLRDLKGQMQQVAKLEDIEARKPLLKTGVERRPPSDTERRLIQQVNEAKRKYGVVVTDPATQLKSAQDAILTRLRHQIADLNVQIENQARTVKTKTAVTTTPEMEALRSERDRLRTQLDELVPKPGISDAQRSQIAERALEADIALYEQRIKSGDIRPLRGKQQGPPTERMDQLRTRRDELKAQLEELRAARDPKLTPEQRALKTLKRRMLTDLSKTQDRINRGDFEPRKRKEPPPMDAEAARIKGELDRTKTEWRQRSVEEARKRMTKLEKAWDLTKEATHAQRQFWTAFDVSAPGRQGAILTGSHPQLAVKAGGSMFKALSEKNADAEWAQIQARPNAQNGVYERAKLYLSNPHDTTLSKLEENVRSRWLRNVPGIKQSNQAYVTFLNRLRADAFDLLKNNLERKGTSLTVKELQGIANYINVATGRGDFGRLAGAAEGLAIPFFSPRLVLSRFQYFLGQPIYKAGSWRVRRMIIAEYAKSASTFATLLTLGMLAGATVETDETSPDFLKLRFGNTRLDIGGGLLQVIVAVMKHIDGQKKTAKGKTIQLGTGFGENSHFDEAVQFARSKFAPTHGTYWDFRTGENVAGEKVPEDIVGIATYLAAPLAWRDTLKIMEEHGIPAGTAIQILSLLGVGVQHYKPRK